MEEGRADQTLARHVLPHLNQFTAEIFEELCRRHLWRLELPFIPERVGAWWSPRGEIDVVAVSDEARCLLVGECKWSVNPVGGNVLEDLRRAARSLQQEGDWERVYFVLFARSGFTPALRESAAEEGVILVETEDLTRP